MELDPERWPKCTVIICLLVIASVGLFDLIFYYWGLFPSEVIGRSFNIAKEESYGTWVSTSLALLTGLVGLVKARLIGLRGGLQEAMPWIFVALFFLFISFDDAAKFHERVGSAFQYKIEDATGTELASWFPSWGWQLYVAPIFVVVGLFLCQFFFRALDRHEFIFALVGFGFFGSAVGMDFLEGSIDRQLHDVHLLRLTEEVFEMIGQTAFLYVLARVTVVELSGLTFTKQTSDP